MMEGIKELRNIAETELGQQREELTSTMLGSLRTFITDVETAAQTAAS